MSFRVPEQYRLTDRNHGLSSTAADGNNGVFIFPNITPGSTLQLRCIASDGEGWEHVSVSLKSRCPTWAEMCYVKELFWDAEDTVMQLHPPKSDWVNNHPYCLHLWKPVGTAIPCPPSLMVGYRHLNR